MPCRVNRRGFLKSTTNAVAATAVVANSAVSMRKALCAAVPEPKSVAAIVTVYRKNSHADVIVGKILEGWKHDGKDGPSLQLASLYVDQYPEEDLARSLSTRFDFPIFDSIADALTLGQRRLAVDGVLCIGEHGDYPVNELGQRLYPRRRFFQEVTDTFERCGQAVPVFNDKHLGPRWSDALWMYERAKQLDIPFMAGSSLPVGYREPDRTLGWGEKLQACVGVGYSGLDIYGFHTLEFMQSIIERRGGGERGVQGVTCVGVDAIPSLVESGVISRQLMDAAMSASSASPSSIQADRKPDDRAVFLIDYADGLQVPVLMLGSQARAISVAWKTESKPIEVTRSDERAEPRYPHFAYLLKGIERMVHTGTAAYPVERTLLAAGVLDRLLHSRHSGGKRLETPELVIGYQPIDYSHAPHLQL